MGPWNSRKDGPVPFLHSTLPAEEDLGPLPHLLEGLEEVRYMALWAGWKAEGLSCTWGITRQGVRGSALRKTCLVTRHGLCDTASEHAGGMGACNRHFLPHHLCSEVSSGETGPASSQCSMWSQHWSSSADLKSQDWAAAPCRSVWAGAQLLEPGPMQLCHRQAGCQSTLQHLSTLNPCGGNGDSHMPSHA